MENEPKFTRIDLTSTNRGIEVKWFAQGWSDGSAPYKTTMCATSIIAFGLGIEKNGYTFEMADAGHGRALCGETTRIDFTTTKDGVKVEKYPLGWTAKTNPITSEVKPGSFDLEVSITWCENHGFTVRRWPGGARAWKGEAMPVRDAGAIMRLRSQIKSAFVRGESDARNSYDLAFDY
jgi:hypothetical protein